MRCVVTACVSVFLVEDSDPIRTVLTQTLESSGPVRIVGWADNLDGALERLGTLVPDAIVIDLRLRSGTGLELLEWLQASVAHKDTLRIVLTNYASIAFRRRCTALGAHYFFDKSLEFDRVTELLAGLAPHAASAPTLAPEDRASPVK